MFVRRCAQKFYTKNLGKVKKILNIQEYLKKFQYVSALLDVCFHMNRLKIKYLSTEKTSKNPRNSAYIWRIWYTRFSNGVFSALLHQTLIRFSSDVRKVLFSINFLSVNYNEFRGAIFSYILGVFPGIPGSGPLYWHQFDTSSIKTRS